LLGDLDLDLGKATAVMRGDTALPRALSRPQDSPRSSTSEQLMLSSIPDPPSECIPKRTRSGSLSGVSAFSEGLSISILAANDESGNSIPLSKTPSKLARNFFSEPLPVSSLSPVKGASNPSSAALKRPRANSLASLGSAMIKDCPKSRQTSPTESDPPMSRQVSSSRQSSKADEAVLHSEALSVLQSSPRSPPLPKDQVDWLMSTLSEDERARFIRPLFLQDCRRRFQEFDTDGSGFLNAAKLQAKLFVMFPTLRLDCCDDALGHRIPALDNSIPNMIATFDSDMDGYIGHKDFIELMKFCQAWRKHFYLDIPLRQVPVPVTGKARLGKSKTIGDLGGSCVKERSSAHPTAGKRGSAAQLQSAASDTPELSLSSGSDSGSVSKNKKPGKKGGASSKSDTLEPSEKSGHSLSQRRHSVSAIFGSSAQPQNAAPNASRRSSAGCVGTGSSGLGSSGIGSSRPHGPSDSSRGAFYSTFLGVSSDFGSGRNVDGTLAFAARDLPW